jgi:hypothetical protein
MTTPKAYMTLNNEPALVAKAASEPYAFAAIYDSYFDCGCNYVPFESLLSDPVPVDVNAGETSTPVEVNLIAVVGIPNPVYLPIIVK